MNICIKSVTTPFSFFCTAAGDANIKKDKGTFFSITTFTKMELTDSDHGQYVAVLWKEKWVRGIISMEANFMIWLVDEGVYIRPTPDTVYVTLPADYKKLPSKVFEASIHGVVPVHLELDDTCQFKKETGDTWSLGAMAKAEDLIFNASSTYFVPIALLTTKTNDVVLGDLYLELNGKFVNFVDEMSSKEESPMHTYMEENVELYIENLSKLYPNRRVHRACLLKPELPIVDLPTITTQITLAEYRAICDQVEKLNVDEDSDANSVGGSSVTFIENTNSIPNKQLKLTQEEIEEYSNKYFIVGGREYNVLTVLMNKARDLYMCEEYKNAKSMGRACGRSTARKGDYSLH